MSELRVYHIPVCPFSQRLEILLALKGLGGAVKFEVVDVTRPRDPALLAKTPGSTTLPILETETGGVLRESLVLMQYLDDRFPERRIAASDPFARAVENMLTALCSDFVNAGYGYVMNQDPGKREALRDRLLAQYAGIDAFLARYSPDRTFLHDDFGWAEAVFTPMFMRFSFVEYYEHSRSRTSRSTRESDAGKPPASPTRRRSRSRARRSSRSTTTIRAAWATAPCPRDAPSLRSRSSRTGRAGRCPAREVRPERHRRGARPRLTACFIRLEARRRGSVEPPGSSRCRATRTRSRRSLLRGGHRVLERDDRRSILQNDLAAHAPAARHVDKRRVASEPK
ncbi:glutathione S-transferase family protein [Nannocystis pusilla]|uniref:glutathione S-transferase family protein n=1 Tax=Nannocystis pusilla TaxID=889268 RepID=UPI003B8222D5